MKYKRKVKSFYLPENMMRVNTDDIEEWLNENNNYEIKIAQVHDIGYASGGKGQYITLILEKEEEENETNTVCITDINNHNNWKT